MERLPGGIYTQEFLAEAVRLHEVEGLTIPEVAKRLSLPGGTLKNRVYAARRDESGKVGKNQKPLTDVEMELARVKRELAEVRMERDLPGKAAVDSMSHCNTSIVLFYYLKVAYDLCQFKEKLLRNTKRSSVATMVSRSVPWRNWKSHW